MLSTRACRAVPSVIGAGAEVPLVGGRSVRYADLDQAASTPALREVWESVQAFMPWYASVHRGDGYKSQVATAAYEAARGAVRMFVNARADDVVLVTRNTTDSVNLLARCLPGGTVVITTSAEHHANMLAWRKYGDVVELPVPSSSDEALHRFEAALRARPSSRSALVAVTGASNVTGEVWPVAEIGALAHRYGASVFVDAAQLAPHRPVDVSGWDVDWVAFSGHKLYAPFGAGALVGRAEWLARTEPYLLGGGAVEEVTRDGATWADLPARHEGGSPNVVGAVALAAACTVLNEAGMDLVAEGDRALSAMLESTLEEAPGVAVYRTWGQAADRVAVRAFNVAGHEHGEVAAVLSAEYGIGVRSGSFCAHPLLVHLAGREPGWRPGCAERVPGAVRASAGLGSGAGDIERLGDALRELVRAGARWAYEPAADGTLVPVPDDRHWPALPLGISSM
jgi:selenocysteine lyase/cysteine desulfurase